MKYLMKKKWLYQQWKVNKKVTRRPQKTGGVFMLLLKTTKNCRIYSKKIRMNRKIYKNNIRKMLKIALFVDE